MAAAPVLSSRIELRISCAHLPQMDTFSKTDAFAAVYLQQAGRWVNIGKTETLENNQSPSFATAVALDYKFEEVQPLRIDVWDFDEHTNHDYIGSFFTTVGRIMGARGACQNGPLVLAKDGVPPGTSVEGRHGTITIRGEEIKGSNDVLRITFRAAGLDKKDLFGKSDPYISILRPSPADLSGAATSGGAAAAAAAAAERQRVWTGPVVKNTLDPTWPTAEIPVRSICGADLGMPFIIEVYDWDKHTPHDLIGETAPVRIGDLLTASRNATGFSLINYKKKEKKGSSYANSGVLYVQGGACVTHTPSLLEYVRGGCQLNLMVAVDFTGSNGDPRHPNSLHYLDARPGAPMSQYAQAIAAVGSILQEYDSDKLLPIYGFGGNIRGATSHCFPLTLDESRPEVFGVEGLLGTYRHAVQNVGLSGPTLFAPMLKRAMAYAAEGAAGAAGASGAALPQRYTTLLLLTDGGMNDADETIRAIVDASGSTPLSIVIVGIGSADFSAMEVLDGDDAGAGSKGVLSYGGKRAARDIVQFVPFSKYAAVPDGGARLAQEVLAEIPQQLVGYFTSRGIAPNPPIAMPGAPAVAGGAAGGGY